MSLGYRGTWVSGPSQGTLTTTANYGPRGAPNTSEATSSAKAADSASYFYLKMDGAMVIALPGQFKLDLRGTPNTRTNR